MFVYMNIRPSFLYGTLLGCLMLSLSGCTPNEPAQAPSQRPNVVLILADDLGYNDLSVYRNAHPNQPGRAPTCQTPTLDALAARGLRLTDMYSGAAVCSPSRAALLTGRNCTRLGIYNWIPTRSPMHLRAEEVTLAERLRQRGYRTCHVGKWHLTSEGTDQPLPQDQGFEHAFYTYNNAKPSHHRPTNFFRNGEAVGELPGYACQRVVDEALQWLDEQPLAQAGAPPFFLNVWFNEPHEKVAAPDSLRQHHDHHAGYYGAIENMDQAIGRLLAYLKQQGLDRNTLVIFTSDNGSQVAGSNVPFRGAKCLNLEGGLRVPFVISWPGRVAAGATHELPASFVDVMPSVLGMLGMPQPTDVPLDGEDLSAAWLGKSAAYTRSKPLFFFRYFHDPVCMLREGDWVLLGYEQAPYPVKEGYDIVELAKLKPAPDEPKWSKWGFQPAHMAYLQQAVPQQFELYNVREDPGQAYDRSASEPQRLNAMKARMLYLRASMLEEGENWFDGKDAISP